MQAMHQAMVANHKNLYHTVTPQKLDQAFAALDHDLPTLSDAQITVRLVAIAALVNDGHSGIGITFRPGLTHVGLWMVSYPDGIFVEQAAPENKALLGARLERIGNVPVDEALARIHTIILLRARQLQPPGDVAALHVSRRPARSQRPRPQQLSRRSHLHPQQRRPLLHCHAQAHRQRP